MATRGGKREGAGKPKGYRHTQTLERGAELEKLRQRVMRHADELVNIQMAKALGSIMFFRVDEIQENGKTKRVHTRITDAEKIKELLDEHQGEGGRLGEHFYIVTAVPPDSRVSDSLLDRAFGKAAQPVELPPVSPQVIDIAEKLVVTLTALNILNNASKVQDAIQVAARLRRLPVEELETAVKGYIETTARTL